MERQGRVVLRAFQSVASILMESIRGPVSMNQGFGCFGTISGALEAIDDPVSRGRPISGKLRVRHHGISDRASHSVMLGIMLDYKSPGPLLCP